MNRSTPELVLLIIATTVAVVMVVAVVGILIVEILHPEVDISAAAQGFTHTLGVLVGVVAGYMLGRGKKEGPS